MEKQSDSGYDPKSVSGAGSKRKAPNAIDQSDVSPSSLRIIAGHVPRCSGRQKKTPTTKPNQIEGHQPMSQQVLTNRSRVVDDDPFAKNLQCLLETWNNNASQGELILVEGDQHQQLTEMKEELAQVKLRNKGLEQRLFNTVDRGIVLKKIIEDQVKRVDEIVKGQNVVFDLMAAAEEHFENAENTLVECEEIEEDLANLCDDAKVKLQELENNRSELFDKYRETETKELVEQLAVLDEELLIDETRYQQLKDEMSDLNRLNSEVDLKQEMAEKMCNENREKYAEEITEMSEIKICLSKLKLTIEEKSEWVVKNQEISKKIEQYHLKCEAQQAACAQINEEVKYLTTTCCELEEGEAKLMAERLELNNSHLASISEKDSEIAECRKQLEDLGLKIAKTFEELIEITEDNKNLSETEVKAVDEMNRLIEKLQNKDGELEKLDADLRNALTKREELSSKYESLNAELISLEELTDRAKAEFDTREIAHNQNRRNISEMNKKIAESEYNLEDVSNYVTQLGSELANKEAKHSLKMNHYEKTIRENDSKIAEYLKTRENLQRIRKRNETEYKKKLQINTNLAEQCQVAGHTKKIQEQKAKIENFKSQISVEKLKLEQNCLKEKELSQQKEIEDLKIVELQSKFTDLKAKYTAAKEQNNDLRTKLEKIQEAKQITNTSPLLGITFAKPEGARTETITSSSPVHSTTRTEMADFEISSDLSSIDGMYAFSEVERGYAKLRESDKIEAGNLTQIDRAENTSSTSSSVAVVPPQQRGGKSYKPCYMRQI